jgi:hypothetical protein
MKTKLIAMVLLAGSTMFAGPRFFFGVGAGPIYTPAPIVAYAPPVSVGPVSVGYVSRPYARAYWVAPRWYSHRYYGGYWRHR